MRVLRTGVCETDLQLIQGYMDFQGVLGHEFVGIAESGHWRGKRVVGEINCSCGKCPTCRSGLSNHCPHRSVLGILNHDGAFADFVAVPERNLHPVPDSVSTDEAVFTEPLAAAFQITTQIDVARNSRAIVLGDGRLGNLSAQVLQFAGASVHVVGKHRWKLDLLERLSITTSLVQENTARRQADIVVDCTGSPTGFEDAVGWVKPRGTLVLKTTVASRQTVALAPLVIDEVTVIGSRCGPFPKALEALQSRQIDVASLVSATFDLDHGLDAIDAARNPDVLKVLLTTETA